jgi:hypothetical protein
MRLLLLLLSLALWLDAPAAAAAAAPALSCGALPGMLASSSMAAGARPSGRVCRGCWVW